MRADFKRDLNHSYLILEGPQEVNTAGYQTRMLLCNHFSSLLSCKIQSMDGNSLFYYEITSRQSLAERYSGRKITGQELHKLFQGVIQAAQEVGSYLLDPGNLVLDPSYIYLDASPDGIRFCYLPGYEEEIGEQFGRLTEYLLPKIDHKDAQAVTLGYGMYRVAMEAEFQMDKIKEELYREYEEKAENKLQMENGLWAEPLHQSQLPPAQGDEALEGEAEEPVFLREESSGVDKSWKIQAAIAILTVGVLGALFWLLRQRKLELALVLGMAALTAGAGCLIFWVCARKKTRKEEEKIEIHKEAAEELEKKRQREDKGETDRRLHMEREIEKETAGSSAEKKEDPEGAELTVVLSEADRGTGSALISKEEGKLPPILLDKDLVVIGKLSTVADVVLPYPTVSRIHSKIRSSEGEYYLTDLNSRNGTFVNGRMLQGEEEYRLQDRDEVQFADLSYLFMRQKP